RGGGAGARRKTPAGGPARMRGTAAVRSDKILVSPAVTGAGPIVLLVSNQTGKPQRITFETDELGGRTGGNTASTPIIAPRGTGRLSINVRSGNYAVHTRDRTIRAPRVPGRPPRKSSQNQPLLPLPLRSTRPPATSRDTPARPTVSATSAPIRPPSISR